MPGFTYRHQVTGQMIQSMYRLATIPDGFVETPEPDGAFLHDPVGQVYQPGFSGDRVGGGGNPEDAPVNLRFRPPGE